MNKLLSVFLLFPFLAACNGGKYKLEGSSAIKDFDGKMVYLKMFRGDSILAVDSAEVIHGTFTMKHRIDSVAMVTLFLDEQSIMPLVIEKGNIKVTINYNELLASGTPLNDALYGFINKRNEFDLRRDELERKEARMVLEGINVDEAQDQVYRETKELVKEMDDHVETFLSANYETVLGPSVFLMLCSTLPYPIMTPQIEGIIEKAPYSFKSNKLVKEFLSKARENKQLLDEERRLRQNELVSPRN
ncbi:MAG: DUF4369 domain-containing protein [Bacteroides sp.]|nr:DUF4369 domain-containing protein [Bacteroides sp.]